MQRLANRYRRDLIWNINGSRVGENVLLTAALRCLPSHVSRRAAARSPTLSIALRQLRQQCAFADVGVACRQPDGENCAGCETGEISSTTPLEVCGLAVTNRYAVTDGYAGRLPTLRHAAARMHTAGCARGADLRPPCSRGHGRRRIVGRPAAPRASAARLSCAPQQRAPDTGLPWPQYCCADSCVTSVTSVTSVSSVTSDYPGSTAAPTRARRATGRRADVFQPTPCAAGGRRLSRSSARSPARSPSRSPSRISLVSHSLVPLGRSPVSNGPDRREALEAYLMRKERDVPAVLRPWRQQAGRHPAVPPVRGKPRPSGGGSSGRGGGRGGKAELSTRDATRSASGRL